MAQLQFDASSVSPESQFTPIPNGDYPVLISESEIKDTKAGTGQYLQLVLEVIDGHYKGRKIWDRLNIVNPNQVAQDIGQRALSQICHAVGVLNLQDTADLHQKPLVAKVVVSPARDGYDESNEVKEYKAYSSGSAGAVAAALRHDPVQQKPAAAQVATGNKPAWA